MVFKSINRIKAALPEVLHVVMFYDNGTIFQTTFDQDINIPKLGENFSELLNHLRNIYDISKISLKNYEKIICETDNLSLMILKLGEESNIALFFKREEDELKIGNIRRYLSKIEELIDMDKKEIFLQNILSKESEMKILMEKIKIIEENIENLQKNKPEQDDVETLREISTLNNEHESLKKLLDRLNQEVFDLKEKIQKNQDK